jgi:hypothetical protein
MEHANLFPDQFMPRIVPVHFGPCCIDELNGSIKIEHRNSLPRLFSDFCETPQCSHGPLVRSNYIMHLTVPQKTTVSYEYVINYNIGESEPVLFFKASNRKSFLANNDYATTTAGLIGPCLNILKHT